MSIEKLKDAGGMAAGCLICLVLSIIPIFFLFGAAEFSIWALAFIPDTVGIGILVCIPLIPLAIFTATRGLAGSLFGWGSLVFGACLWLYCLAFTYIEWGMGWVILGVLILGFGVVFMAILAAVVSGTWVVLGNIGILFALYLGTRFLSVWLSQLSEQRQYEKWMQQNHSQATIIPAHRIDDQAD